MKTSGSKENPDDFTLMNLIPQDRTAHCIGRIKKENVRYYISLGLMNVRSRPNVNEKDFLEKVADNLLGRSEIREWEKKLFEALFFGSSFSLLDAEIAPEDDEGIKLCKRLLFDQVFYLDPPIATQALVHEFIETYSAFSPVTVSSILNLLEAVCFRRCNYDSARCEFARYLIKSRLLPYFNSATPYEEIHTMISTLFADEAVLDESTIKLLLDSNDFIDGAVTNMIRQASMHNLDKYANQAAVTVATAIARMELVDIKNAVYSLTPLQHLQWDTYESYHVLLKIYTIFVVKGFSVDLPPGNDALCFHDYLEGMRRGIIMRTNQLKSLLYS